MPNVLRLPHNPNGRDFVAGDIHGEFEPVELALAACGFDPSKDRLFCVGDLIDRGTENYKAIEFLKRPGVFCVLGNHDADLIEAATGPNSHIPKLLTIALRENNQLWFAEDLYPDEQKELIGLLQSLPLAIEISTPDGPVGIVHAEPLPHKSWAEFIADLERNDPEARFSALWGRAIAEDGAVPKFTDACRVFAGHTPCPDGVMNFGPLFIIDTGSVFGVHGYAKNAHFTLAMLDAPDEALLCPRTRPSDRFELKMKPESPAAHPRRP